ncbi:diguanylate cyclase domain-containing protein [Haematobacter missouriensis]|uniref:diguanylate cyclase n=2 Tax=Haematobacter missouriensis TaxID=366616 RepID=A0A212AVS0_9RHOB|nr:diguanylate cyclase [Haematobacter missouriensis]OWJ85573.1 diguanylate cyclase response regulator [Haematobacter missouriensis]
MVGKILIVDGVATNRIVLKVRLASACYETIQAETAAQGLTLARSLRPDAILLDVGLATPSCAEMCRTLRRDPRTRRLPVIVIGAAGGDQRLAALRAGADDAMPRPVDDMILLARLRSLLRASDRAGDFEEDVPGFGLSEAADPFEAAAHIAVVTLGTPSRDPRPCLTAALGGGLTQHLSRADALGSEKAADLYLLTTVEGQEEEALQLMSDLRSRPSSRDAAICIQLPESSRSARAMAFDLGASDVVDAEAPDAELAFRLQVQLHRKRLADRRRASLRAGLRLAVTDPLTGLPNRRHILPEIARTSAAGRSFAVLALDIDRFKVVNDTWGHAAGDAVLVELARRIGAAIGNSGLLARIGGEEFLVLLPDAALPRAQQVAEDIRRATAAGPVSLPDGAEDVRVTLSVGVATGTAREGAAEIIRRADQALLRAKAEGRDKVSVSLSAA